MPFSKTQNQLIVAAAVVAAYYMLYANKGAHAAPMHNHHVETMVPDGDSPIEATIEHPVATADHLARSHATTSEYPVQTDGRDVVSSHI